MAVDETNVAIDGEEVYVRAAADCATLEVLAVEGSPGRSSLDALLFLEDGLARCRGQPLVRADRGPRDDWPLEVLECEVKRKRGAIGRSPKRGSGRSRTEPGDSGTDFPYRNTTHSTRSWLTPVAARHDATR